MYVLDEPSIGLHQRDNERLLGTLIHLRNLGNTVIVVEHDEDAIRAADHVIDIGPGAGVHGGQVVAEGKLEDIMAVPESLTGQFMSGKRKIEVPKQRVPANPEKVLKLSGARGNNLKDVTLTLPVGLFTCITGVSGSGKSTLINDTLFPIAQRQLNGATIAEPAPYRDVQGLEHFDKVIDIDQSPIGRTPRSNPQPTPASLRRSVNCLPAYLNHVRVATRPAASVLTCAAVAVKPAGRWRNQSRDALPAGYLRTVRSVQRQTL